VPEEPLTLPQLAQIVDVEYRTLHTWLKRGLISPSVRSSSGTGTPNLFAHTDAVRARIVADLREAGLPLEKIAEAAEKMGQHPEVLEEPAILQVNGTVRVITESDAITDLQRGAVFAYNTRVALDHVHSRSTR
jgi:DNA-binding transcriptional MerR regulator